MTTEVDLSESLYTRILDQIALLIDSLGKSNTSSELSGKQNAARKDLQAIRQRLEDAIGELRQNSEWQTFTIAFYGETNAGKSTLIDTLRILLNEPTKVKQREQFRALQQQLGLSEASLETLENQTETLRTRLDELAAEMESTVGQFDLQQSALRQQIEALQSSIDMQKRSAGLFRRLVNLFRRLPEEHDLQRLRQEADSLAIQRQSAEEGLAQQETHTRQEFETRRALLETALGNLGQLEVLQDGSIIGDGRSDYTRTTGAYTFRVADQAFTILDVPGIEGNEACVSEEISSAVSRAHAVFYVTGKAAPPQTGDNGQPGTLEKIRIHLGSQTEVWTLFNKRITNPMALQKPQLLSMDEQSSLAELDARMKEQLGEHYQRTLSVCGLPAFLAAADCLAPRSKSAGSRKKFLASFSAEELLEKSGFRQFYRHLTHELVRDYRAKIRRSNLNKVSVEIERVCSEIGRLRADQFIPLEQELRARSTSSGKQLRLSLKALESRLANRGEQAIASLEGKVREEIYECIDRDISNDDFKNNLQALMEREQQTLQGSLPDALDRETGQFQTEIAEILDRYQHHARELLNRYETLRRAQLSGDFTLDIRIDSGVNLVGLLASLAGGALMFWNPAGWALVAVGVITVVAGLTKAVWGFFDSDYKKGQQRKAADENLEKVVAEIRRSFKSSLDEALPAIRQKIIEIEEMLHAPVRETEQINQVLERAGTHLQRLAANIRAKGAH